MVGCACLALEWAIAVYREGGTLRLVDAGAPPLHHAGSPATDTPGNTPGNTCRNPQWRAWCEGGNAPLTDATDPAMWQFATDGTLADDYVDPDTDPANADSAIEVLPPPRAYDGLGDPATLPPLPTTNRGFETYPVVTGYGGDDYAIHPGVAVRMLADAVHTDAAERMLVETQGLRVPGEPVHMPGFLGEGVRTPRFRGPDGGT